MSDDLFRQKLQLAEKYFADKHRMAWQPSLDGKLISYIVSYQTERKRQALEKSHLPGLPLGFAAMAFLFAALIYALNPYLDIAQWVAEYAPPKDGNVQANLMSSIIGIVLVGVFMLTAGLSAATYSITEAKKYQAFVQAPSHKTLPKELRSNSWYSLQFLTSSQGVPLAQIRHRAQIKEEGAPGALYTHGQSYNILLSEDLEEQAQQTVELAEFVSHLQRKADENQQQLINSYIDDKLSKEIPAIDEKIEELQRKRKFNRKMRKKQTKVDRIQQRGGQDIADNLDKLARDVMTNARHDHILQQDVDTLVDEAKQANTTQTADT
jgi:hypothetical protein